MEDSSIDTGFDAPADQKIPIALGILGIIVGGLALIIAFVVRGKVDRFTEKVSTDLDGIHETVNAAGPGLANESAKEVETLRHELDLLREQFARKLESVDKENESLRAALIALDKRLNNPAPRPASSGSSVPAGNGNTTASGSSGEYTIQAGDNFWKIATKFGCKPADIQELNPDVEPARLRVGQKIKVPAK